MSFLRTQGVKGRAPSILSGFHSLAPGRCWLVLAHYNGKNFSWQQSKKVHPSQWLTCPPTCLYSRVILSRLSYRIYWPFCLTCGHGSLVFLSVKKVRKLQIRFQVFIVIFIFISEFNKFVGFLWCQLFIGLSRLIPWQFSSRDEFYWFEKRSSFIAPLFLLLRRRTKRKRARSSWR